MGMCSGWIVVSPPRVSKLSRIGCLLLAGAALVGCQTAPSMVANRALLAHLPGVNYSGLRSTTSIPTVKVDVSLPAKWTKLRLDKNLLYTNQQWKAPSGHTGVGVVYIRLPMALSPDTLLWFAKLEYSKKGTTGQALGQWTDALGRPWFEAENDKYHVRGYAVVIGYDAWLVYCGYRTNRPLNAAEMNLAIRSIETVAPKPSEAAPMPPVVARSGKVETPTKG